MTDKIVILDKKEGKTPLECLNEYRNASGETRTMTYAGRLDPMASGLLLVLLGEECKNKEKYIKLDKVYEFEILVGFNTDTHDILGLPSTADYLGPLDFEVLQEFVGKRIQTYPAYSSKTVGGIQLHNISRQGKIGEIQLPTNEIEVFEIKKIGEKNIKGEELIRNIIHRIGLVSGDFRQNQIEKSWSDILAGKDQILFKIYKFHMSCSSGTYVRALVRDFGAKLGIPMCTWSIRRTKIGDFNQALNRNGTIDK